MIERDINTEGLLKTLEFDEKFKFFIRQGCLTAKRDAVKGYNREVHPVFLGYHFRIVTYFGKFEIQVGAVVQTDNGTFATYRNIHEASQTSFQVKEGEYIPESEISFI